MPYATEHPNLIVRALEAFREANQMTVARHCNVTRINQRTYEAWLSGRRNPEADHIRWVVVQHRSGQAIGVLYKLEPYKCPRTGHKRFYAVVFDRAGQRADAGDGDNAFDATVNAAQKAGRVRLGTPNTEFRVVFVPDIPWAR